MFMKILKLLQLYLENLTYETTEKEASKNYNETINDY